MPSGEKKPSARIGTVDQRKEVRGRETLGSVAAKSLEDLERWKFWGKASVRNRAPDTSFSGVAKRSKARRWRTDCECGTALLRVARLKPQQPPPSSGDRLGPTEYSRRCAETHSILNESQAADMIGRLNGVGVPSVLAPGTPQKSGTHRILQLPTSATSTTPSDQKPREKSAPPRPTLQHAA